MTPPGEPVAKIPTGKMPVLTLNWDFVEQLALIQCTADEIAEALGVSKHTLYSDINRDRFMSAMERGRLKGRESIRRAQFRVALGDQGYAGDKEKKIPPRPPTPPDRTMLIWLGKVVLGQVERTMVYEPDAPAGTVDGRRVITIRVKGAE